MIEKEKKLTEYIHRYMIYLLVIRIPVSIHLSKKKKKEEKASSVWPNGDIKIVD